MSSPGSSRPKVIVLSGPTAVGKTRLSLTLAQELSTQIINADSLQVYRFLDIGTAKPTPEERARVRHHLIDLVDPDENFDAARYLRLARPLIDRLHRRGRPALVVGGTGLYLRSLLRGLFPGPGQDPDLRARLNREAGRNSPAALHARLAEADPEAAGRIHPRDQVRIIRALEVYELTGRPISAWQAGHALGEQPYQVLFFCLTRPREELYQRINERTAAMFQQGLIEEVRCLLDRGYSPDLKPFKSIGYHQAVRCLQGRLTLEEALAETARKTRQLAKRQLTWHRGQSEALWRQPHDLELIINEAKEFADSFRSLP